MYVKQGENFTITSSFHLGVFKLECEGYDITMLHISIPPPNYDKTVVNTYQHNWPNSQRYGKLSGYGSHLVQLMRNIER